MQYEICSHPIVLVYFADVAIMLLSCLQALLIFSIKFQKSSFAMPQNMKRDSPAYTF